jgi:hypothetical protein
MFTGISMLGAYFFALTPFSRAGPVVHQPSLLSVCYDSLLFIFQFCRGSLTLGVAHWLRRWTLWSTTCPALGSGLLPTHSWPSCLSGICLLIVLTDIISWALPLSPVHFQLSCPLCCCNRLQFAVCCSVVLGGISLHKVCAVLSRGSWGNSVWHMVLICLVSRMSCRQIWSQKQYLWWRQPSSFFSVKSCEEAFHGLGVQGVKGSILVGVLFPQSVAPVSQQGYGVRAQGIYFCTIVTILDLPSTGFNIPRLHKYRKYIKHIHSLHALHLPYASHQCPHFNMSCFIFLSFTA